MKVIRRRGPRVLGAALVLAATGLLASGAAGSVSSGGKAGGTLTIALAEDPDALDPTLARTSSAAWCSSTCARSSTT